MSYFTGSAEPSFGDNEIDSLRKWAELVYQQSAVQGAITTESGAILLTEAGEDIII